MVEEMSTIHEDLIALDQRRTNRLTVPSQCGDVITGIDWEQTIGRYVADLARSSPRGHLSTINSVSSAVVQSPRQQQEYY